MDLMDLMKEVMDRFVQLLSLGGDRKHRNLILSSISFFSSLVELDNCDCGKTYQFSSDVACTINYVGNESMLLARCVSDKDLALIARGATRNRRVHTVVTKVSFTHTLCFLRG